MKIQSIPITGPILTQKGTDEAKDREFSYNPQDQVVLRAGASMIEKVRSDVSTAKLKLVGGLKPNADGKFVYATGSAGFHGANAFASAVKTLETFEKAYGQTIQWSTGNTQLEIHADQGEMLNAYYDRNRGGLFFFHSTDPVTKKVVHSADSGEVTGHECGHAILDAIRPKYMSNWSPDPGGFHESFGDVIALFRSLQEPAVLEKVAAQTGGDLKKANISAALGEEMGIIINHTAGKNATGGDYTRNAINDFVWQEPGSLPKSAPPDQLSNEVHSWSRLWTGAVYDLLNNLVQENLATQGESKDPKKAISQAVEEGLQMYGRLMKRAPQGSFTYRQMAAAFVQSDLELNGGKRATLIGNVFSDRKILQPGASLVDQRAAEGSHPLKVQLDSPRFGEFSGATVETELSGRRSNFLQDHQSAQELQERMADLIQAGEIRYTQPGEAVDFRDLIKPNGQPYIGVLRWDHGQKVIERVTIVD